MDYKLGIGSSFKIFVAFNSIYGGATFKILIDFTIYTLVNL
jgi:hypothetical protein